MSMLAGTAFNASCNDSCNNPQDATTITTTITKLNAGSSQYQPVKIIATPAITTPNDTAASAAMCKYAPRILMSCLLPFINKSAEIVFTTIPTPATIVTVKPATAGGSAKR